MQKAGLTATLRLPNTNFNLLSELAKAPKPVATSSILANSPGASVLSHESKLLRASLSKAQRLLQARKSKLIRDLLEGNARCAEFELSLDLSKPWLLKLEGDHAKTKPEDAKALEHLGHRDMGELSDQAVPLQQNVLVLKKLCLQKEQRCGA